MKNIFKNYTNTTNLVRNKNYISLIALSAIAFNCDAWDIENQKDSIGLTEKHGNLYYGKTELTTQNGNSLKDSLYNCKKIIKDAYNDKARHFDNLNKIEHLKPKTGKEGETEKCELLNNQALLNGLVLYCLAHKYFQKKITLAQLIHKTELENQINNLSREFKFDVTESLKHDINWYINNEKWRARDWFRNVNQDEHTDHSDRVECYTYERYQEVRDKANLHVIVDSDTLSKTQINNLQNAKSQNQIKELEITLAPNSLQYTSTIYKIPEYVTHVDLAVFDATRIKSSKNNNRRYDYNHLEELVFPNSAINISQSPNSNNLYNKKITIYIAEDGSNIKTLNQLYYLDLLETTTPYINNQPVNVYSLEGKTGLILSFDSCDALKKASKKENEEDIIDWFNNFKKYFSEGEVHFSKNDLNEAKYSGNCTITISKLATHIDHDSCESDFDIANSIILELAEDGSNFGLFKELTEKYAKDKVKLRISKHDIPLKKIQNDEQSYYTCEFNDYIKINNSIPKVTEDVRPLFKSIRSFKTQKEKWTKEESKKYLDISVIQLAEDDIDPSATSMTIDEYVTKISYDQLFSDAKKNIKNITFKISPNGLNLELLKTIKKNTPTIDIDTRLDNNKIEIDYKGEKLYCNYAKHHDILALDNYEDVTKKLILTFDSYEDIKKTINKTTDTAKWLQDLKNKTEKGIKIKLTKHDIHKGESLTIYEYYTEVDDETIKLLKETKDIIFRIATDGSNFKLLERLLKSEYKVKTYIDEEPIDIKIYKDQNDKQYLRCAQEDYLKKIVKKKYLALRLENLKVHFKSEKDYYDTFKNDWNFFFDDYHETKNFIDVELSSDDIKSEPSITIPAEVNSIADSFFDDHTNVTSITLKRKDFSFKKESLNICKNLETIYIHKDVDCDQFKKKLLDENPKLNKNIKVLSITDKL